MSHAAGIQIAGEDWDAILEEASPYTVIRYKAPTTDRFIHVLKMKALTMAVTYAVLVASLTAAYATIENFDKLLKLPDLTNLGQQLIYSASIYMAAASLNFFKWARLNVDNHKMFMYVELILNLVTILHTIILLVNYNLAK